MPGRAVFVTGTDTGVGKTWVTARLARAWTETGSRVAALKVAESGCRSTPEGLVGEDDEQLFQAAGAWQPERCRYRFKPAVAPGVAADELDMLIDFDLIERQVEALTEVADRVLIEGAGGWLVPMGGRRTIEDLAKRLALPVLIVARAGLGTINHTGLTVRAVRSAGLSVAAVALSIQPGEDTEFALQNQAEIGRLFEVPVVSMAEEIAGSAAARIAGLL